MIAVGGKGVKGRNITPTSLRGAVGDVAISYLEKGEFQVIPIIVTKRE
jgi:hypothetical protein